MAIEEKYVVSLSDNMGLWRLFLLSAGLPSPHRRSHSLILRKNETGDRGNF